MNERVKDVFPGVLIGSVAPFCVMACTWVAYLFHKCVCLFIITSILVLVQILLGVLAILFFNDNNKKNSELLLLLFGFLSGISMVSPIAATISILSR